jgi:fatty-acyl-CoA synthase
MLAGDILAERARLSPQDTALVCVATGVRFSYRNLDQRADARASQLHHELKLLPGDRVGILSENRVEFLDCFFAAGRTGLVFVPLNTRLTATELEFIVRDNGMKCLLYTERTRPLAEELQARMDLSHWISLDVPLQTPYRAFVPIRCNPEDTYCLLYTSGTTGQPKGVMLPHRMIAWNAYNTVASWQLRSDDVTCIFTPLYHAGGLAVSLLPLFLVGGTVVLHDGFHAEEVWQSAWREGATILFGVPTIFKMLMEAPDFVSLDLGRLRWCISGGAPLPHAILDAYHRRGIILKQGYGLTEAGVNCFAMNEQDAWRKAGSIGKPMLFTQVRLMHGDAEVADGQVGEIWIRGPHVASGYWNRPNDTASTFTADGWLRTGDLARRDDEGFFEVVGRIKELLISGGVNLYPAEIEAAMMQHPLIEAAAVFGVPDEKWGEIPIACVVTGGTVTEQELVAFLTTKLAKYKIPRKYVYLDDLPRTAYGKVIKSELRDFYLREECREPQR